jgi:hypothetical protein
MMMHQLMQAEEDAATDEDEKLLIISTFLHLRATTNAQAWQEGLKLGRRGRIYAKDDCCCDT